MDNRFYFGFNTSEERKKRRKAELYSMSEQVSTFFWDEAPQHGLEMREGQQDMSFEIVDALINDQHFAIEAGVGIGKSFGYLVPVLLYSKRMNKPVIIATSTIALQEQLWRDVHAVMPLLGLNRDVILAKGQTHYLCNKRADEYMCDPKADPPDALKEGIQQGYEERKDFPEVLPQGVWDKVNVQRFSMKNCGSCEKKCKYYKVRAALKFTDGVVLCNQDFLTQHFMKLRRGQEGLINAAADLLVVDEAHNLDDKVRSATTERFGQHAMIYYCDDLPHPTREHEAFIEKGVERLLEILNISNGKALVLFTAKTDMEEVYSILSQKNLPYKILMQQPGSSQDKVLLEFKEDTNSVLLGTGAYWEGISIEGKSLSNVIIFRLPFPVPDPIIEYKCSVAKDALMDVRVPEMIIKLKQGIGRLIRNFTDTGIVCIIDRRLRDEPPERYHDIAWDSLPIKNRTSSLDELKRFYESLPSAKE